MTTVRNSLPFALSVWKALFLREAVYRLFGSRAAWAWLLLEPLVHIGFLLFLFTTVRMRVIGGIDTILWLMCGLVGFFIFKRTLSQSMNAIGANQALFAYRQVKPVDTVLSRAFLEGLLMFLIAIILFVGAGMVGFDVIPADPMGVLIAFLGLWLLGLGMGLMTSVATELLPEVGKMIGLLMTPLYFISGVIFPLANLPSPYREWIMFNPVAHGLEIARISFALHYQAAAETSAAYLYASAISFIFLGIALHVRFALRLAAK